MYKTLIISLLMLSILSCENNKTTSVIQNKIVAPINLTNGKKDIILSNYVLDISKIDSIESSKYFKTFLSTNKDTLTIIPNKYLKHLENLRIYVNDEILDIPLIIKNSKKTRFSISKNADDNEAFIKGDFTDWKPIPMINREFYWEYKTKLSPGEHKYIFVINDKDVLDSNNINSGEDKQNGKFSIINIPNLSGKTPSLNITYSENDSIEFTSKNSIEKCFVYLGNKKLDNNNIVQNIHTLQIKIPTERNNDSIRVFSYNLFGNGNAVGYAIKNNH